MSGVNQKVVSKEGPLLLAQKPWSLHPGLTRLTLAPFHKWPLPFTRGGLRPHLQSKVSHLIFL